VVRAAEAVKAKAPAFELGKRVTVLDENSAHYGQPVEVVEVQGVVVQAKTETGQTVPFLSNELSRGAKPSIEKVSAAQKASKPNPVENLAAELEVEKLRCEALEERLEEAIALLAQFQTHPGVVDWIASAQALMA
jgi:hypothetical protein